MGKLVRIRGVGSWKEVGGEWCMDVEEVGEKKSMCRRGSLGEWGVWEVWRLEEGVGKFCWECVGKVGMEDRWWREIRVLGYRRGLGVDVGEEWMKGRMEMGVGRKEVEEVVRRGVGGVGMDLGKEGG